jgi:hypothetical protein
VVLFLLAFPPVSYFINMILSYILEMIHTILILYIDTTFVSTLSLVECVYMWSAF